MRNYISHGAFGKDGRMFQFHSNAGAVPVFMPSIEDNDKFFLTSDHVDSLFNDGSRVDFFEEEAIFDVLQGFTNFLWRSSLAPAMYYLMKSNLPTILTMVRDGTYASAMCSIEAMEILVRRLVQEWDDAANMDW